MGKLKISEIYENNFQNFIKNNKMNIEVDWIVFSCILNVVLFGVSLYLSSKEIYTSILLVAANVSILILLANFLIKIEKSKKNLYLYFGIYTTMWSVSGGTLLYVILNKYFGTGYEVGLSVFLMIVIIALITIIVVVRRIKNDYYIKERKAPEMTIVFVIAILILLKVMGNQYLTKIIVGCLLFSLASAANVYYILIYYSYKKVEQYMMYNENR